MVRYNTRTAEESRGGAPTGPGTHHVVVKDCQERQGPSGTYFALRFHAVDTDSTVCFDNCSFSAGAIWITHQKFKALGVRGSMDDDIELEAVDLIGRTCYVTTKAKPADKDGKVFQEVDIRATEFCGYEPDGTMACDPARRDGDGGRPTPAAPAKAASPKPAAAAPRATKPAATKSAVEAAFDESIPF